MNPLPRIRSLFLGASLCVLWAVAAAAQPQVEVTGNTLSVGPKPTTPVGSSVRLDGLGTSGGATVLFSGPLGDVIRRVLAPGDIPTVYTRRDVAEAIAQDWQFNAGLRASGVRGTTDRFNINNTAGSVARLAVFDDGTTRNTSAGTYSYVEWNATGVAAGGAGSKWWRSGNHNGLYAIDMIDNGYSQSSRPLQIDGNGNTGVATRILTGPTITQLQPGRQLSTDIGTASYPYRALHVGELQAAAMVVNETQAYTEASLKIGRGSTLSRAIASTAGAQWLFFKTNFTRYLDFLIMRGLSAGGQPQFEVFRVKSGATADCTGAVQPLPSGCFGVDNDDYAVLADRDADGSGPNAWEIGSAIVSMDRWIDIFSDASGTLSYGSAVLGDRPSVYWNFEPKADLTNPPIPTPNRSRGPRGFSGATTTLTPAANATIGGCGWSGCTERPPYGSWAANGSPGVLNIANGTAVPELDTAAFDYAMTVEFVMYAGLTAPSYTYQPVSKWNYIGDTAQFAVYVFGADNGGSVNNVALYGAVQDGGSSTFLWTNLTPLAQLNVGGWYHIVCTWDSYNGGRIYVNGVQQGSVTPNPGGAGAPRYSATRWPLRMVGQRGPSDSNGTYLGEVAIYEYELSADQVAAHYSALGVSRASTTSGPTMVGWVGGGTNWYDMAPRWAAGNLNGLYDYPTETYGFAAGDYTKAWIAADPQSGFRVMYGNTPKLIADAAGNLNMYGGTINSGVVSGGGYLLSSAAGVRVAPQTSGTWENARSVSIGAIDATGQASKGMLNMFVDHTGLGRLGVWFNAGATTLLIGDDLAPDQNTTNLRLWNNGSTTTNPVSSGIDIAANGVQFRIDTSLAPGSTLNHYVRPILDNTMTLGHQSQRWRNIHLTLPSVAFAGGQSSGIIALDPTDQTRLAYINWGLGTTGGYQVWLRNRNGTGECYIVFLWGLAGETNCTP